MTAFEWTTWSELCTRQHNYSGRVRPRITGGRQYSSASSSLPKKKEVCANLCTSVNVSHPLSLCELALAFCTVSTALSNSTPWSAHVWRWPCFGGVNPGMSVLSSLYLFGWHDQCRMAWHDKWRQRRRRIVDHNRAPNTPMPNGRMAKGGIMGYSEVHTSLLERNWKRCGKQNKIQFSQNSTPDFNVNLL